MEPVRCLDCGFPLGMYYEAFIYLKNQTLTDKEVHVDKKVIDLEANENLINVFEKLKIYKYCCRGQLISCRNMSELDL